MAQTPGPWSFVKLSWGIQVVSRSTNTVVAAINTDTKGLSKKMIEQRIGDAWLIAAAPDLLEACKASLDELESIGEHSVQASHVREMLRAAIEKAEGEH